MMDEDVSNHNTCHNVQRENDTIERNVYRKLQTLYYKPPNDNERIYSKCLKVIIGFNNASMSVGTRC